MAIEYTWAVTSVKTKTEGENENAVVQTYWTKTGVDEDGNEGSFSGATPFSSENTENFVAFAELTEEIVLGWIQAIVVEGYEDHVNGQIQKQINEKISPVTETAMPWATEEETEEVTAPV